MTVEELKKEAAMLGYYIIKKPDKYVPCKCGSNRKHWFWTAGHASLRCNKCGFTVTCKDYFCNDSKMRKLWNDTLKGEN